MSGISLFTLGWIGGTGGGDTTIFRVGGLEAMVKSEPLQAIIKAQPYRAELNDEAVASLKSSQAKAKVSNNIKAKT